MLNVECTKTLENTISCDEVTMNHLLSRTTFSRKKIAELYADLLHDCPSGKISPAKFVAMFEEFFSTGNAEQFNAAALFRTLDADRSGSIDFTELVQNLWEQFHQIGAGLPGLPQPLVGKVKFLRQISRRPNCLSKNF